MLKFKEVPDSDRLFVSNAGHVYQIVNEQRVDIDKRKDERGKCMIRWKVNGVVKRRELVWLVLQAFSDKPLGDRRHYHLIYKDGNSYHCGLDNLTILVKERKERKQA